MKKLIIIFTILNFAFVEGQIVNIPDQKFKSTLLVASQTFHLAQDLMGNWTAIDINNDNEIQLSEAQNISGLFISSRNIESLNGISSFTSLTKLYCADNKITNLDLTNNISLKKIICESNNLVSLNVSNNISLEFLRCFSNNLTALDISNNTSLKFLNCSSNSLKQLDLSNNEFLEHLVCIRNELSSLDLSKNISLRHLSCTANNLSNIDLSNNQLLKVLYINGNLNLSNLDLNENYSLETIDCSYTNLSTLDVSKNTSLTWLRCGFNENLSYINLKNGNNHNFNDYHPLDQPFIDLPNLETVCVDSLSNSSFLSNFGPTVNFTEKCGTLHSNEYFMKNLSLHPIPTSKNLHIKANSNIVQLEIYNNLGQLISLYSDSKGLIRIDLSGIIQGLYICKLTDENGNYGMKKIIKR